MFLPQAGAAGAPRRRESTVLTQLFDAFLVLDEELYPRDVYV